MKVIYIRVFLEKIGRFLSSHLPITSKSMLHLSPLLYGKWSALVGNLIHVSGWECLGSRCGVRIEEGAGNPGNTNF